MKNYQEILDYLFENNIFPNAVNRCLLYGPPGTGKSGYPYYATKGECERITLSPDDTPDALLGFLTPDISGVLKWQDGPALRAMKKGTILVLDEVDECSPECLPVLNAILDDKNMVKINTPFGTVKPADGFAVFATTNKTPDNMRESLRSRFDIKLFADTPTNGVMKNIDHYLRKLVLDAVKTNAGELKPYTEGVTPRSAIAFSSIRKAMQNIPQFQDMSKDEFCAQLIWGSYGLDVLTTIAGGNPL
tara:strand:+ start:23 stop:763 length:741 start_codon:yes stop_codon:yes gene_type:complete